MQQSGLPHGFISFDDAVKLIQSDTLDEPKVNMGFLTKNLKYLDSGHNFTIKLVKKTDAGKLVETGTTFVEIKSEYEKATLAHVIEQKYAELTRRQLNATPVRKISTMTSDDPNMGNPAGHMQQSFSGGKNAGDAL